MGATMASRFVCDLCGAFSRNPALAGRLHVGCPNGAGVWLVDGSPARAQCNDCGELDQDSSFCGQLHRHTDAGTTCAGTWIAFQRLAPVPLSPAQGGAVKSVPTLHRRSFHRSSDAQSATSRTRTISDRTSHTCAGSASSTGRSGAHSRDALELAPRRQENTLEYDHSQHHRNAR